MIIQHDISSINTNRQLGINDARLKKAAARLASGYQINSAADNAAGLTISEKLRGQIRGLERASDNLCDGISYVQVADGALNEVHAMLHRMREVAVQSANDTNVNADRAALDAEIQQLKAEMDHIFENTEFNTRKIWEIDPKNSIIVGTVDKPAVTSPTYYYPVSYKPIDDSQKFLVADGGYTIHASADDPNDPDTYGYYVSYKDFNGTEHKTDITPWPDPDDLVGTHTITVKNDDLGMSVPLNFTVTEGATLKDVAASLNGTNGPTYGQR